jgi:hypothetical protein
MTKTTEINKSPSALQKKENARPGKGNFFGSSNRSPFFQPKLTVNAPNDTYEAEADAVAEKVMRMPATNSSVQTSLSTPVSVTAISRKCSHCEEEEKLQRKEKENESEELISRKHITDVPVQRKCAACEGEEKIQRQTDEILEEKNEEENIRRKEKSNSSPQYDTSAVESTLRTNGQPLDNDTRDFMERRFGYDFSNVQVHTGAQANKSSADINALAYTHQNHIVFGKDQYQPNTDAGKRLLAHELTHVVQQQGNSLNRKELVQRAGVYWMPEKKTGKDVHADVLEAMGKKNKGKGIFSEAPIPNAVLDITDPAGAGKIGFADLLKTSNNKLVGIYKVNEGVFRNISDEKIRQILFEGKNFSKKKFTDTTAPLWDSGSKKVTNVANAPTSIEIADLKPYEESAITGGKKQLNNYIGGFKIVQTDVNMLIDKGPLYADSTTKWNVNYGFLKGLDIPDEYAFPTATGQGSKDLLITFGLSGSFFDALKKAGSLTRIKEYERIRDTNILPGKLYVVESDDGIYTYAYIPDAFTNAAAMGALPGATLPATPEFTSMMTLVNNDIKGRLTGSSFAQKKSLPASEVTTAIPVSKTVQPKIQRKDEKEHKDSFDDKAWSKSVDDYQVKFDASLKTKEMKNLISYGDQVKSYEEFRKTLPKAKLPALSENLEKPANQLTAMEVWTWPGIKVLGFFRKVFGKTFEVILNTYENVKTKIKNIAKKKDGGSVSTIAAAAMRIALKVIKLIGNYVVGESLTLVMNSLKGGITNNLKLLYEKLMPDEIEAKIEEFTKLQEQYQDMAMKTIDDWKKSFFGEWIDYFEKAEKIREEVQPKLELIEKLVRWGAGIIACLSPPAIGCLWNIFKEIGMYFIAKIIQTCWFGSKIMGFVLDKIGFIKNLPATIAGKITEFGNNNIPLPKGMAPLFTEIKKVDASDYNMECNEFDEGGGGSGGGDRGELWDTINEIGEEKFKAFLTMMEKRGAGPWVLLTPERLKNIKDDLKAASIEDLNKIANGEKPETGITLKMEEFLKDIHQYTDKEKKVKKEFFDEKKKREEAKGKGGEGKGSGTGDAGTASTKAPIYEGKTKKGSFTGGTTPIINYTANVYVKNGTPLKQGDTLASPVKTDLKIYFFEADSDEVKKIVSAPGLQLDFVEVNDKHIILAFPEETIIEYGVGKLRMSLGFKVKIELKNVSYKSL